MSSVPRRENASSRGSFTHSVRAKDGSWSGSVTPMGATSAAHAKGIIEQDGKYEVTTGKD
jgi:hypothetical protein